MFIYNTTYEMPVADARDFVIWAHQVLMPRAEESGMLHHGRLSRILSHKDESSECFALQFEVESSARLHHWYVHHGERLNKEMLQMFGGRVVGFSTWMEVIEE